MISNLKPQAAENPLQVDFNGARGLTLKYRGVPVIRQSSLYIVKPGWAGLLYDQRTQKQSITRSQSGELPKLTVTGENSVFRAQYQFEAVNESSFRIRFEGRLLQDVPAAIEYAAGYFNANLIAGRPYQAQTKAGTIQGVVPVYPASDEQSKNDLAPNFTSLDFDSRLGQMKVEVQCAEQVTFFDARRDSQDWAKAAPVFWCGLMAGSWPLQVNKPVQLEMLISLHPIPEPQPQELVLQPSVQEAPIAQGPGKHSLQIIPQPKRISWAESYNSAVNSDVGDVNFRKSIGQWSVTGPQSSASVADAITQLMQERFGLQVPTPHIYTHPEAWTVIKLGNAGRGTFLKANQLQQLDWARNPEGYRLKADTKGITISAPTAAGAFYGVQTLAQVLQLSSATPPTLHCPTVIIEDWPTFSFRGAHWFPSASGVPFDKKLIQRIMARYKLNAAVMQCEAARWESHPEIAAPNSIYKADLQALVALCRHNFIEPIPLINTPGHAEWMFRNGQHLDLAEDPSTPYAYCVNNPRSDAFIKDILGEAIEVFKPSYFHLGHDEVTMRGRFPNPDDPRCRNQSVTDLVLTHATRLDQWLAERKIRMMIWGDMLLSGQEGVAAANALNPQTAQERRQRLPKDITVADWQYSGTQFPSQQLLHRVGLQTIACTWYDPQNIYRFTQAARQAQAWGLLQTTWAGYFPDETVLESEFRQFSAFILAAEYTWTGRTEVPAALPYDPAEVFRDAYFSETQQTRPGTLVNLIPAAQVPATDWLGLGPGWELASLLPASDKPQTPSDYDGILFHIPQDKVVVLGNTLQPAGTLSSLTVEVHRKARHLALLNATVWSVPNGTIAARMLVDYADGSQRTMDLVTGRNTASWQQDSPALYAPIGRKTKSPASTPIALRVTRWQNPDPQREISRIRFVPVDAEASLVLAGVTLIQ